ncbi:hypothetical protein ACOSP7_008174 [Xanthoceras sorbifolium]
MQQKWLTKLLGYDYDIFYKKGKENVVADGLSRAFQEEEVPSHLALSTTKPAWVQENDEPSGFEIEPRGFEDRTLLGSISNPEGFEERRTLWVRDRTQRVRRSNPSGFDLEPRRVRRSNPSGFVSSNPEGFMSSNPSGFDLRTLWVPRTQRVRSSNPLGSTNPEGFETSSNPSRFEIEPRGFDLRTLWVPRTQKGSKPLRTLLGSWNPEGSRSNPEGFDLEPSGFDLEPSGLEERTLWVRGTQRVRRSNPLGSISNPEGFEDTNPSGFVEPRGFEERTLWVRGTQRVRRTNPLGSWNPEGSKIEPSGFDLEPRRVRSSNPSGQKLVEEVHSSAMGGHSGIQGTMKRLQLYFYWDSMLKEVTARVLECAVCQENKSLHSKPSRLLQPLPIPNTPWLDIAMDFIEGLPRSADPLRIPCHVSQLKAKIGDRFTPNSQLPHIGPDGQILAQPVAILDRKMVKKNNRAVVQYLIQWSTSSPEDATWEDATMIRRSFPTFDP